MTTNSYRTRIVRVLAALLAATWMVALPPDALAQVAPAGNAHPTGRSLSESGSITNPFGEPNAHLANDDRKPMTPEAKFEFASRVDLSSLRGLAVFHNGRVKILDTLANETVHRLTGRRTYVEPRDGKSKQSYNAIFTMLDLMIDPAYYADKPLLHVNYLPLREEILDLTFPGESNAGTRERWMKFTRVTPLMVRDHIGALLDKHGDKPAFNRAFSELDESARLWQMSVSNLLMVAPDSSEMAWTHLSLLPADHGARRAAAEFGAAWRAGDASKASAAAGRLAEELPKHNASVYPTGKRRMELTYNRVNAFEWGFWAYAVSLVTLLIAFGTGRPWLRWAGMVMLTLSVSLHAFGFVSRCLIAERFAIQNQFESMTGLSLFATVVGLAITLAQRKAIFGAAAAGVGFLVLVTATQTAIPGAEIGREAAILNTSVLLKYHVTTVLVSYGLIALGFIVSLFYLGTHYAGALRTRGELVAGDPAGGTIAASALGHAHSNRGKLLSDLDTAQMTVLQLAFWTLGVGVLLGAWWADHSWGRWWAFDPKETWALVTWIIYLIVIHLRFTTTANRGLVTAWMSVVGFGMMIWTYFGVNLLLPGLHAYA